jgi:hypothetical protein
MNCQFQNCSESRVQQHHVTYYPPVIKYLCAKHHEDITIVNGQQARRCKSPLTNSQRWAIWYKWLSGDLKPRRTEKALEYIDEMNGCMI